MTRHYYDILIIEDGIDHQLLDELFQYLPSYHTCYLLRDNTSVEIFSLYNIILIKDDILLNTPHIMNWLENNIDIPIVVLTNSIELGQRAQELGVTDYLELNELTPRLLEHTLNLAIRYAQAKSLQYHYLSQLQKYRCYYEAVIEVTGSLWYEWIMEEDYIIWGKNYQAVLGYSLAEIPKNINDWIEVIHPDDLNRIELAINNIMNIKESFLLEYRIKSGNDQYMSIEERGILIQDRPEQRTYVMGVITDITDKKRAIAALYDSQNQLEAIASNVPGCVYRLLIDSNNMLSIPYISEGCQNIFGLTPDEIKSNPNLIGDNIYMDDQAKINQFRQISKNTLEPFSLEYRIINQQGTIKWVQDNAHYTQKVTGEIVADGVIIDISERKEAQTALYQKAYYDKLTGLPNRDLFLENLKQTHQNHRRASDLFAVLFLDLDRFKIVNDSLGHRAGDDLLIEVSQRLKNSVRAQDIVARLSGDEFVILLQNITMMSDVEQVCQRIQTKIKEPFKLHNQSFFTTVSIGVALNPNPETSKFYEQPEDLIRDADLAMFYAKRSGKARYVIFHSSMTMYSSQLQLENELRAGIAKNELIVYYQPIVNLKNQEIIGFEALSRWNHPTKGLIYPNDYISLAQQSNLIILIEDSLLIDVFETLYEWRLDDLVNGDIFISINLSPNNFTESNLVEKFKVLLNQYSINGNCIHIELTEKIIMNYLDNQFFYQQVEQLKDLGIVFSIDDFGSGYFSFIDLPNLPIDLLKIHHHFIDQIHDSKKKQIIKTIIDLAINLELEVVAEGVETDHQKGLLEDLGCEYGQGYLFHQPLSKETITQLLQNN